MFVRTSYIPIGTFIFDVLMSTIAKIFRGRRTGAVVLVTNRFLIYINLKHDLLQLTVKFITEIR